MRVLVSGSLRDVPEERKESVRKAAQELGGALAAAGHTVLIGTDSKEDVDPFVAEGVFSAPKMPHTSVDHPDFVPATQATFLSGSDVVIGVTSGGIAKAYPAAHVGQHGVVHDQMPDGPIAVTWCGSATRASCSRCRRNGASSTSIRPDSRGLIGGNEVFKDRETGSRWQQATGTAISGPLKGTRLELYPFLRTNWGEWKRLHPGTLVLKPLPGYAERMPYVNKVIRETRLGTGPAPEGAFGQDNRLRPRETVVGLEIGGEAVAFPFSVLRKVHVVNEKVGQTPVLIVHQPGSMFVLGWNSDHANQNSAMRIKG